jgi:membrane associated rhomboid family serine protease
MMTPWVKRLLLANGGVFLAFNMLMNTPGMVPPDWAVDAFGFSPARLLVQPWSPFTYMFLHGGFMHLLFNMIALFFFGPRLEVRLGSRRFLALYFISGLAGALLSVPFSPYTIIGASGAVYGVLLGFARYWPRERIYIWGVLPVEARVLVIVMVALSLFGGFGGGRDGVAHFAHLGGFLGGYAYLRWIEARSPAKKFKAAASGMAGRRLEGERAKLERWSKIDPEALHEINRERFDEVWSKLQSSGAGALSPREQAFLDRFSSNSE